MVLCRACGVGLIPGWGSKIPHARGWPKKKDQSDEEDKRLCDLISEMSAQLGSPSCSLSCNLMSLGKSFNFFRP